MKINRQTGLHWRDDRKRRQEIGEKVGQRWRKNSFSAGLELAKLQAATHSPPRLNMIELWHWMKQKSSSQESRDMSIDQKQSLSELSRSVHRGGKTKPQGGKKGCCGKKMLDLPFGSVRVNHGDFSKWRWRRRRACAKLWEILFCLMKEAAPAKMSIHDHQGLS